VLLEAIDFEEIAREQLIDEEIPAYRTAMTSLVFEDISLPNSNLTLLCDADVSTGTPQPVVPLTCCRRIFETIHGLSHPSIRTTKDLIASKFVWHKLRQQVTLWAKTCVSCQASKVQFHEKSDLQSFPVTHERFADIHVDIVGPLPQSYGFRYLFTVVDRYTRWPEAIPMIDATTTTCIAALLYSWISHFGVPRVIVSNRGPQFTSSLWSGLSSTLGINIKQTTAYHSQANGIVEQLHRQLKASLMAHCIDASWYFQLPWTLLGIHTDIKEDIRVSTAELVYGQSLIIPGQFVDPRPILISPSEFLVNLRQTV